MSQANIHSIVLHLIAPSYLHISIEKPHQHFDPARQAELNASVNLYGVTQNVIVRQLAEGSYELIAGERRLIAAIASNHTTIPAKINSLPLQLVSKHPNSFD